jgi:autophagy-related protein 18
MADIVPYSSLVGVVHEPNSFSLLSISASGTSTPILDAPVDVGERILAFRLNAKRVLVLTSARVMVYDLVTLRLLGSVSRGSVDPPSSVMTCSETGLVAVVRLTGSVLILDSYTMFQYPEIAAHSHQPTALDFTSCGRWLATASKKGTLVRIFQLDEQSSEFKLVEVFRRGRTENVIENIQFSKDAQYVVAVGSSDTAHVFKLASSASSSFRANMLSMLPQQYKDVFEAGRDFAFVRLRKDDTSSSLMSACVDRGLVIVLSKTYSFVYELKPAGGECQLRGEYVLVEDDGRPDCRIGGLTDVPSVEVVISDEIAAVDVMSDAPARRKKKHISKKAMTTSCGSPNASFHREESF